MYLESYIRGSFVVRMTHLTCEIDNYQTVYVIVWNDVTRIELHGCVKQQLDKKVFSTRILNRRP